MLTLISNKSDDELEVALNELDLVASLKETLDSLLGEDMVTSEEQESKI